MKTERIIIKKLSKRVSSLRKRKRELLRQFYVCEIAGEDVETLQDLITDCEVNIENLLKIMKVIKKR